MSGLKTMLFGLQKQDLQGKSVVQIGALYLEQLERSTTVIALATAVLCIGGGMWSFFAKVNVADLIPYAALLISFLAINAFRIAGVMPMLQMVQSEQQRVDAVRLAVAIQELVQELREDRRSQPKSCPAAWRMKKSPS